MGLKDFRWVRRASDGYSKLWQVWGVLDGCKWVGMGIEGVLELIWMAQGGMECLGQVKRVWVGEKSLGLLWGDQGGYTGPRNSVGAKDEYGVPDMSLKGFCWVWSARDGCELPQVDVEGLRWV